MSETQNSNAEQKGSWVAGIKSEFSKINWLSKKDLGKQTLAVIIVSVILGFIIAILDTLIQYGVDFLTGLGA